MKLFVSDIDGTLINSSGRLSVYSRKKLLEIIDAGILFTVASARSVASIQNILADIPFQLPIITFNGAFISDYYSGEHSLVNSLESSKAMGIYKKIKEHSLSPIFSTFKGEDRLYLDEVINEGMRWYKQDRKDKKDRRMMQEFEIENVLQEEVICINIIAEKIALLALREELVEEYGQNICFNFFENDYSPGWFWLTIQSPAAQKGLACKTLCERLGVNLKDLVVFGDHHNDLSMFEVAGTSVAVANAQRELRAKAQDLIDSNDKDSVVEYILKHS